MKLLVPSLMLFAATPAFAGVGDTLARASGAVGPFHLVLLHLPIGLLAAVWVLDLLSLVSSRRAALGQASLALQWFGAPCAVAAAVTGFMLSRSSDIVQTPLLERHMWLGWGVAMIWLVMLVVRQAASNHPTVPRYLAYALLLLGNGALTACAGHVGGTLVHGEGFLTRHLPGRVKAWLCLGEKARAPADDCLSAGEEPPVETDGPAEDATVYQAMVAPILDAHCRECHGPKKARAKLRLDTPEHLLAGGESGPVLVAGDPAKSPLHVLAALPPGDPAVMPPGQRPKLTPGQLRLLAWWIAGGASFETPYEMESLPEDIRALLPEVPARGSDDPETPDAPAPSPAAPAPPPTLPAPPPAAKADSAARLNEVAPLPVQPAAPVP